MYSPWTCAVPWSTRSDVQLAAYGASVSTHPSSIGFANRVAKDPHDRPTPNPHMTIRLGKVSECLAAHSVNGIEAELVFPKCSSEERHARRDTPLDRF